jgi:hypothetical protein
MSAAYAVYAFRERAHWGWIVGGSLSIFSGVLALWSVPHDPVEIAAGRFARGSYVVQVGSGWYGVERDRGAAWAWTSQRGELKLRTSRNVGGLTQLRVKLRAITPREAKISIAGRVAWQGLVRERAEWVAIALKPEVARPGSELVFEIASEAVPIRENGNADARALGIAVYGVAIE